MWPKVHGIPIPDLAIPPTLTLAVRSFAQRPKAQSGVQHTANMILSTLKSYSLMMIRHDTLPPFVHPHYMDHDSKYGQLEPLANCVSLVRIISGGFQAGRKLFWKNVRSECDRIREEVYRPAQRLVRRFADLR